MASTNGVVSPQPQAGPDNASLNISAKRKRSNSIDPSEQYTNGTTGNTIVVAVQRVFQDPQEEIADFLEVLQSHDISSTILSRRLPAQDPSSEPNPKRKKSEEDSEPTTISTRAAAGNYKSLDSVVSDIKSVTSAILEELQLPNGASGNQYTPTSPQTAELATKVSIFTKIANELVAKQKLLEESRSSMGIEETLDLQTSTNGTTTNAFTQLTTTPGNSKLVLTLYGNAPGPKQLFSSLQEAVASDTMDVTWPLREAALPNGISTTQIVPIRSTGLVEEKKRIHTLGELFSSSSTALPFQPPKPSRVATTRSSVVGWYQPAAPENHRLRNSQSYFGQNITTGQWLDYTSAPSSTLDAKRKQRERALSLSGVRPATLSPDTEDLEALKNESLFRSAYSSFAPVKDDAAAIVPEGLLSRLWWQRSGEKNFERLVSNAVNLGAATGPDLDKMQIPISEIQPFSGDETDQFKDAVDQWDEEAIDPSLEDQSVSVKGIADKDVEEILQDISELLETLNSYQRIRNLSLNPIPRIGGTLAAVDSTSAPTKPGEGEIAIYNILKSQLSLMIAMLPPYAVAKLNSDQLSELNISTKMQVITDSYKGVMEEDEFAARAKVAAMTTAASTRPALPNSLHRSSSSSLYGNQYSSTSRPAVPNGQQYYPQAQTPVRTSSTNIQRPPSTAPAPYGGQRPASSTPYRTQTAYATPTYPHQVARPAQQYGSQSTQQYYQTPSTTTYSQTHNQGYGSVPQSAQQRYQGQNQNTYQQRPSQNGQEYRYPNGTAGPRQASPQKSHSYSPQSATAQVANRPFGTPTPAIGQDRRYFQQPLANGTSSMSPQPQSQQQPTSGHLGATGYHTVMTPAEQSAMMERQRAQLAQQQGTQHQARNAAQAGAMGTSPQSQVNGGSAVSAGT